MEVSALRSQVSGLRSQVSSLRSQVSGLRSQVSGLGSRVSGLRSLMPVTIVSTLFLLFPIPIAIGFSFESLHLTNVSSTYSFGLDIFCLFSEL